MFYIIADIWTLISSRSPGKPFFLTSALTKGFEMVSLAVSQRWPVLLYGPSGGGKTALIEKLALDYGSRGMLLSFCIYCELKEVCLESGVEDIRYSQKCWSLVKERNKAIDIY